jgi:hypothetical protein
MDRIAPHGKGECVTAGRTAPSTAGSTARQRTIGRILRWGAISAAAVLGLALVLFVILWLVNARDEELTPETRALLQVPPNPYPPADNIYLALAGFEAPPGESVIAEGEARVARYNRELEPTLRNPSAQNVDALTVRDPRGLSFVGRFEFAEPVDSYWDDIPPHRANVEEVLGNNLEFYQRYLALHRQRGYYETARPSYLAPVFFVPRDVRTLFLAETVLRLRAEDADAQRQAMADLEDDLRLWRSVLTGTGGLISKMLAIAYLHWDELLIADVIADPNAPLPMAAVSADALVPLFPLDDWDISKAYSFEFRAQVELLHQTHDLYRRGWVSPDSRRGPLRRFVERIGHHIGGQFFKVRATLNLFAAQITRLTRAAAPGALEVPAPPPEEQLASLHSLYNPVGKVLASVSASAYEPYPARAWDGAAFQRLLRLSYEIRRQHIAAAAIPAFLRKHPEWSTHPASGRPFVWDERTGTIRVQTLGPLPAGRAFALHVWRRVPEESGPR